MSDESPDRNRGPRKRSFRITRMRPDTKRDLDDEIEFHFERTAAGLIADGWSEEEAMAETHRRFGDEANYRKKIERVDRGRVAMERRSGWVGAIGSGLSNVGRNLRRHPGFALGIVLTLALGIGANAAIFSIVDRLLLSPPEHIGNPGEVRRVVLERTAFDRTIQGEVLTYPDFLRMREQPEFEWVAARSHARPTTVGRGQAAHSAQLVAVSWEFFPMLGVGPHRGRFFSEEEDGVGAGGTVVLGREYWESRYGADPGVLGRTIEIEGRPYEVIGIAPERFTGIDLRRVDLWVPIATHQYLSSGSDRRLDPVQGLGSWWLRVAVRMADDASPEAAASRASTAHVNARADLVEAGYYDANARVHLTPLIADRGPERSDISRVALWLAGVSLLVLLVACANVANLLLAREEQRKKETAVRLALGISRARLIGEQFVESVGLAAIGGGAAILIAWWGGGMLREFLLPGVVFGSAFSPRTVGFVVGASLLAGIASAWGPAIRSGRADLLSNLKESTRGSSESGSRIRRGLTVLQAGLSTVLLVGAGLFVHSLSQIAAIDLGMAFDQLVMVQLELDDLGLDAQEGEEPSETELGPPGAEAAALREIHAEADRRLEALGQIRHAAFTSTPWGWAFSAGLRIPGLDSLPRLPGGGPYHSFISPDFFSATGTDIVMGRPFNENDVAGSEPVVIVNQALADAGWPGRNPIGQCLQMGHNEDASCRTVVGVAEDASRGSIQQEPYGLYYLPMQQSAGAQPRGLIVRADDPEAAAATVMQALRGFDPRVRFVRTQTAAEFFGPQTRSWRLGASVFSLFGLLALIIAAVGLYSLLAFDVARRTRELGIRTALGAGRGRLRRMVLAEGSRLALFGVVIGLGVSAAAAGYLGDLLFETSPRDPAIYAGVGAVLVVVALLASWLPALRATRVETVEALRAE